MNEQELAGKIVQRLDAGLDCIKQGTLYQLQSARLAALARHNEHPVAVGNLAWAGNVASNFRQHRYFGAYLAMAVLLLSSLIGVAYWQGASRTNDIAEIDASLLAGELPIDAYLDSNFEAWLKRSSQ